MELSNHAYTHTTIPVLDLQGLDRAAVHVRGTHPALDPKGLVPSTSSVWPVRSLLPQIN